jgi:N utilization substance protein A
VVVPDNQLSLAIGKRGQNARLAAKLTGLRVDIKSETEVEEERRREEEERILGREALVELPGVGPQLVERLVEAGLSSPARIVRGGLSALETVPGVGEKKATSLLASATEWVVQHPAPQPVSEAEAAAGEATVETEPEGHAPVEDRAESAGEGSTAEHPPRASAG